MSTGFRRRIPREGSGGSFGAEPGQVQQIGFRRRFRRRFQEALVKSQVKFNGFGRRCWRRPGSWCRARSRVQQGSIEGSGEGLEGFGAEPGQVQQGSREGSGEGLVNLVRRQVRFNRVPDSGGGSKKLWRKAKSG